MSELAKGTRGLVALTVVAVLLILAGGWFLAISPVREATAAAEAQTQQVEAQNAILAARNAELAAHAAKLPQYREELAGWRAGIPAVLEQSAFLRQLDEIAVATGVVIVDFSFDAAIPVDTTTAAIAENTATYTGVAAAPEQPAAEPTPTEDGTAGDAAATPEPETGDLVPGLFQIPGFITVQGTYEATKAFMDALQLGIPRLFLANTFATVALEEGEAGEGLPATVPGDVTMTISGALLVLLDDLADKPEPPTGPLPVPGTPGTVNPFLPIEGAASTPPEGETPPDGEAPPEGETTGDDGEATTEG